jgi:chromosome segregation ATPase
MSAREVQTLRDDLKLAEREIEDVLSASDIAAKSALAKYEILEAKCAQLEISEEAARLSKDSAERKLGEAKKSLASATQEHQRALVVERQKAAALEQEVQRLDAELEKQRARSQERLAPAEQMVRTLQNKLAAETKAKQELQRMQSEKDRTLAAHAAEVAELQNRCEDAEDAEGALDTDVQTLLDKIALLESQLKEKARESRSSYDAAVLARKQEELVNLEKKEMESKISAILTEIDSLRALWRSTVEEARELKAQNEALSAHNNRLELQFNNVSIQLEETMAEAAEAQMKMLAVLKDVTGLRSARDQAISDLEASEAMSKALEVDVAKWLEKLKDSYMEVERRKAEMYELSQTLSITKSKLEDTTYQKTTMEQSLRQEIETRDKNLAELEMQKDKMQEKMYNATDSMLDAQEAWGAAEEELDRLRTDLVEFEEMTTSMQDYVGNMYEYQETLVDDLDTIYGVSTSSQYLSQHANSPNAQDRLAATRYVHG